MAIYLADIVEDIVNDVDLQTLHTTVSGYIVWQRDDDPTISGAGDPVIQADVDLWLDENYDDMFNQAQRAMGKVAIYDTIGTSAELLEDLVDGLIDNDGVTYTLSGTGITTTFEYPLDFRMRRATIYSDDSVDCYISTSSNGNDFTYWATDGSHEISSAGELKQGIDEATASGNYWSLIRGTNSAEFPAKTTGKYCRLHLIPTITGSVQLWQVDFQDLSIATSLIGGPPGWTDANYEVVGAIGDTTTYDYTTVADAATYWTDDSNAADGNENTFAYRDTNEVAKETSAWLKGTVNDFATATGTINTVEIGLMSSATTTVGKGATTHYSVPIFGGTTDGAEYSRINVGTTGEWYWHTITNDSQAPGTWNWSDIQALDVKSYVAQAVNPSPAWYGDWAKRLEITVDKDQFDSTLTWFPLMIELGISVGQSNQDVSAVFDEIGDSQYKIQFTDANQNPLYCEIEWWDGGGEYAVMWMSKEGWSISSSQDTTIYLYYDSTKSNNTTYVKADGDGDLIFNDDYEAVWHLNSINDSKYSDNLSASVTAFPLAKIGYGYEYESTNLDIADANGYTGTSAITVQAWRKDESHVDSNVVVSKHGSDTTTAVADTLYRLYTSGSDMAFSLRGTFSDIDLSGGAISNGTWYMQAGTWSNATGNAKLYRDDSQVDSVSSRTGAIDSLSSELTIGAVREGLGGDGDEANYYDGDLDEIRISNVERSAAWIKADYQTGDDNTNTFGSEELYTNQTDARHKFHEMAVKVTSTRAVSENKFIYITDLLI